MGVIGVAFPAASDDVNTCRQPTGRAVPPFSYQYESGEDLAAKWNPQILDYLNATGSDDGLAEAMQAAQPEPNAQPTITVEIVEIDVTGDGEINLLVNLNLAWGAGYNRVLVLYGCSRRRYELLGSIVGGDFYDSHADRPPTLLAKVVDMNANGRPEIISREITVTQKFLEAVRIYEWDGEALAQTFDSGYSLGFYSNIQIEDADNDPNTLELLIADSYGYGTGVAFAVIEISRWRPVQDVYVWDGGNYIKTCRYFTDDPFTLFETLHSAESHRACGDLDNALRYYQRMINDPMLQSWEMAFDYDLDAPLSDTVATHVERAYLTAFAHYRIAQIHLTMGNNEAAREIAAQAQAAFPGGEQGHQYATMTSALVAQYEQSNHMAAACLAAANALPQARTDGSDPGIDPEQVYYDHNLGWGFYYYSGFNYSSDPHNIFAVPQDIRSMISIPICL